MVPVGIDVNRRQYNKSFTPLRQVGWECFDAAKDPSVIDSYLAEAKEFPNIGCAVLDDFIVKNRNGDCSVEKLWQIREKLHNNDVRALDLWMALYTYEFGLDEKADEEFKKYIEPFDGIIMWTWKESDVNLIPEK